MATVTLKIRDNGRIYAPMSTYDRSGAALEVSRVEADRLFGENLFRVEASAAAQS